MKEFIQLNNVCYKIKNEDILKNISFSLYKDDFVSIIGPNGSGKTTIGKIIMGIIKPTSGEVLIDKRNINEMHLANIGRKIGYLFQNPDRQIFAATVYDELTFAMKLNKISQEIIQEKVNKALLDFDLLKIKDSMCHTLSQGEKQRLALAVILLNNSRYLILDEPTTGLDIKRKKDLSKIIKSLRNSGIGITMISHDIEFVKEHSNRIIKINNGSVIDDKRNRS